MYHLHLISNHAVSQPTRKKQTRIKNQSAKPTPLQTHLQTPLPQPFPSPCLSSNHPALQHSNSSSPPFPSKSHPQNTDPQLAFRKLSPSPRSSKTSSSIYTPSPFPFPLPPPRLRPVQHPHLINITTSPHPHQLINITIPSTTSPYPITGK